MEISYNVVLRRKTPACPFALGATLARFSTYDEALFYRETATRIGKFKGCDLELHNVLTISPPPGMHVA